MNGITDAGLTTYRWVLGDAHVDRGEAARTGFGAPFRALITDAA
ncbi:carboxymuconolactone decarboxylase family protein [Limimaricola variabilis]